MPSREAIRACRRWQCVAFVLALAGCRIEKNPPRVEPARNTADAPVVLPGVDVLLRDSLALLRGRRVGLITNQTGITISGISTIDALAHARGVMLTALFSPEHGIRGQAAPGERVAESVDPATGLPIRSLYGATSKPSPAMLRDIDVLVFDIQDVGARYYTYAWTMALALQAAAEQHKRFVVLDRPDPIGGAVINGNVLDSAFASFVGLYPVPMRYGMTVGELARMISATLPSPADLHVIPLQGWRRDQWFDQTGLLWVQPSPNMPSIESAASYPGTCLFEGTNLSVGRGTALAFQQLGAPWLDAAALVRRLASRHLPGVRFDSVTFTPHAPSDGKYDGVAVRGIRFVVTDRGSYDPAHSALAVLLDVRTLQPDSVAFNNAFDHLAGTDRLRVAILANQPLDAITRDWNAQLARFRARRERFLIYR